MKPNFKETTEYLVDFIQPDPASMKKVYPRAAIEAALRASYYEGIDVMKRTMRYRLTKAINEKYSAAVLLKLIDKIPWIVIGTIYCFWMWAMK